MGTAPLALGVWRKGLCAIRLCLGSALGPLVQRWAGLWESLWGKGDGGSTAKQWGGILGEQVPLAFAGESDQRGSWLLGPWVFVTQTCQGSPGNGPTLIPERAYLLAHKSWWPWLIQGFTVLEDCSATSSSMFQAPQVILPHKSSFVSFF